MRMKIANPKHPCISIHALRVEGDRLTHPGGGTRLEFLSTPSGWRATLSAANEADSKAISIHALRVEGDCVRTHPASSIQISIHALRVEGDITSLHF